MNPALAPGRAADVRQALLTEDPVFRTAVVGLAGALGHSVAGEPLGDADVTICDLGSVGPEVLGERLDPLRTIVCVPANPATGARAALLGEFLHVVPRGRIAAELPRLLALLA